MNRTQMQFLASLIIIWVLGTKFAGEGSQPRQSATSSGKSAQKTNSPRDEKPVDFTIMLAGEKKDEDGVHLAITAYLSSNRVGLTVTHNEFVSEVAAREYLEKVLLKAVKITERGKKKDKAGTVVGERAEAILPAGSPDKPMPAIVLTFGRHFYEIQSDSPSTSRALEMKLTWSN